MTDSDAKRPGENGPATLREVPSSCDCVWTIATHSDGHRSGSIFIASERCQKALMHPRTFTEEATDGR